MVALWRHDPAHAAVKYHAKGMLLEAKRAGEALLKAKAECPHGSFKAWVECETGVPYQTAAEYMRVARVSASKDTDLRTFEGGIRAFLDQHRERGNGRKLQAAPTFTKDDAEYALKLHALVERGEGGEALRPNLDPVEKPPPPSSTSRTARCSPTAVTWPTCSGSVTLTSSATSATHCEQICVQRISSACSSRCPTPTPPDAPSSPRT